MIKTLNFVLFGASMLVGANATAAFTFDKTRCLVTSEAQVPLTIGDEKMPSKMRTELIFKGSYVQMPRLQITFLSHEPAKASIEWKSIVSTRKSVRQFRNDIFDRVVSEESKPFAMTRISPQGEIAVFETQPLSLGRSQDLIALFLSQNEITVHAYTEQGDDWTGTFPLASSDSSFREMAAQCYSDKSASYVRGKGQRVDIKNLESSGPRIASTAIHWSEGYGLTEFTKLNAVIPSELRDKFVFSSADSEDTINKQLATWIQLLSQKSEKSAALKKLTADPKYITLNAELSAYYQELLSVYERFVALTGNDSQREGLIETKIKSTEALELQLSKIEAQIVQAQTQLAPITTATEEAKNAMAPFAPTISNLDSKTAVFNDRVTQIKMLQDHLQVVLSKHMQELTTNSLTAPAVEAPWSTEEIDKKDKEVVDSIARIQVLLALQSHVATITADVEAVVEKARVHQEASLAYLQIYAQQAAIKAEITKEKSWLYKSREVPNFTVAAPEFFAALNTAAEQEIATQLVEAQKVDPQATRTYKWEFDFHSQLYNRVEEQFLSDLGKLQSEKSLIAVLLCHPDVLKDERNRKKPCLIIDDALNDKTVENFFANLPPEDVDGLLGDVPRPWNQEKSKTEVLFEKYQQEIANPSELLQKLVDTWGNMRQVIWRWVAMQKKAKALDACGDETLAAQLLPSSNYTDGFYNKVIECERAQVQSHDTKYKELLAQLDTMTVSVTTAESALQTADDAFNTASRDFVTGSIEKLKTVAMNTQASQIFTKCLLPLEKAEECSAAVLEVANGQLVSNEKLAYLELVKAMVGNINGRLNALTTENSTAVAEIQKTSELKSAYITENNIAELITKRDSLVTQLTTATNELNTLLATKSTTTQSITVLNGEVSGLQSEASQLIGQITTMSLNIEKVLPEFQPFCQQILPNTNGIHEIDISLYKLLNVQSEPQRIVESSCERPDLKTFIPNQKSLSLTGINPR